MIDFDIMRSLCPELTLRQLEKLDIYAQFLVEYNEKVNLTAITAPREIEIKHFADCLSLAQLDCVCKKVLDVGSGAGFPGAVLKIAREELDVTLLDSTGKKVEFLRGLSERIGLPLTCVHARAEEAAHGKMRESFDTVTARAVAPLNVLSEYCLPFVRVGGSFIAMKGADARAENEAAKGAVIALGGAPAQIFEHRLADGSLRSEITVKKISQTLTKYPRGGGKIKKNPL